MAEQYVVNNNSLVATADAIRTKMGNTSGIEWNNSTGFASAIEAISGETKIATGSITVGSNIHLRNNGILVQGIGFKPKKVILYRTSQGVSLSSLSTGLRFADCIESGEERVDLEGVFSCYTTGYIHENDGNIYAIVLDQIVMSPNENGSFIMFQWFDSTIDAYAAAGSYNWVAIG